MAHVFQFERLSIRTRSFKHFKVTKTASGRFSISQRVNYYNIAVGWGVQIPQMICDFLHSLSLVSQL